MSGRYRSQLRTCHLEDMEGVTNRVAKINLDEAPFINSRARDAMGDEVQLVLALNQFRCKLRAQR